MSESKEEPLLANQIAHANEEIARVADDIAAKDKEKTSLNNRLLDPKDAADKKDVRDLIASVKEELALLREEKTTLIKQRGEMQSKLSGPAGVDLRALSKKITHLKEELSAQKGANAESCKKLEVVVQRVDEGEQRLAEGEVVVQRLAGDQAEFAEVQAENTKKLNQLRQSLCLPVRSLLRISGLVS